MKLTNRQIYNIIKFNAYATVGNAMFNYSEDYYINMISKERNEDVDFTKEQLSIQCAEYVDMIACLNGY